MVKLNDCHNNYVLQSKFYKNFHILLVFLELIVFLLFGLLGLLGLLELLGLLGLATATTQGRGRMPRSTRIWVRISGGECRDQPGYGLGLFVVCRDHPGCFG